MMENKIEQVDIREKGRDGNGQVIASERRLFMQLLAYGACRDTAVLTTALTNAAVPSVLYADVNDPQGVALVTFAEEADYFVEVLRPFLNQSPFNELTPKPEYTMFGRTYALGYENDLNETLVYRPVRRALDAALPWVIWYPLRRAGSFEQLAAQKQRAVLMEHGGIGMAYGRAGLGHDIRLACHGLDKNDNDFIVGLLGPQLAPLSKIVQRMRKTKQTALHLAHLGPFFTGKVVWQSVNPYANNSSTQPRAKLATLQME